MITKLCNKCRKLAAAKNNFLISSAILMLSLRDLGAGFCFYTEASLYFCFPKAIERSYRQISAFILLGRD